MSQVSVLFVGLDPALAAASDPVVTAILGPDTQAIQAGIDRALAGLRNRGYDADFCGTDAGKTAPDVLLGMMRAKSYSCIVFSAGIRLVPGNTRLLERLLNLAQITKPDTVIIFDLGPGDTVAAVRRWYPSSDAG